MADFAFKPPAQYHIVDKHTGTVVGKAKNLRSANRMVDRRDNEYGAYRYTHRRIDNGAVGQREDD